VAVLGVDNDTTLQPLHAALSSIDTNAAVGYEAAALLIRMMRQKPPSHPCSRIPGVVRRQSTDMLAIDDVEVAKALRFIREHACGDSGQRRVIANEAFAQHVGAANQSPVWPVAQN
jgi:LacI family transcriptional regulator